MSSIPLPNQIKVAPKPVAPETENSPVKPVRRLRPHLTSRIGDKHSDKFVQMAEAAQKASKAVKKFGEVAKPNHPKGTAAQAEPVRNQRRTGRRAQRP